MTCLLEVGMAGGAYLVKDGEVVHHLVGVPAAWSGEEHRHILARAGSAAPREYLQPEELPGNLKEVAAQPYPLSTAPCQ